MKTTILFTLPAANVIGAEGCVLLGEFNDWDINKGIYLARQDDGSMTTAVELDAGRDYQYRYLLSNGRWVNDNAEKVHAEIFGFPVENCIVRVPEMAAAETAQEIKPKQTRTANKTSAVKAGSTPKTKQAFPGNDDLTKIEGVGKKIAALLNEQSISSFDQLAKTPVKKLKEILDAGGNRFRMHNPGSWPKQAKLAAEGKWDALEQLQQQLKGGK